MNAVRRRGFTLIELLCVVLVMLILLTAALPSLQQQWRGLQTERAAMDVAQLLRTARTLAVAQGRQVDWLWQEHQRTIRLAAAAEETALEPRWQQPRLIPDGVTLVVRQEQGPVDRVSFFSDGTSGASDRTMRNTTVDVAQAAKSKFQIVVDGARGRVTIQRAAPSS